MRMDNCVRQEIRIRLNSRLGSQPYLGVHELEPFLGQGVLRVGDLPPLPGGREEAGVTAVDGPLHDPDRTVGGTQRVYVPAMKQITPVTLQCAMQ